ncbi:MAG: hypothetical protein J5835_06785 [Bacteroidales bacterium]|nr:hypothetical protein [Bacteroidales bacterium]
MKHRLIITFAASFFFCTVLSAQGSSSALPFTRIDVGPVLTGTAGAAVTADAGAWSAFRGAASGAFMEDTATLGAGYRYYGGDSRMSAAFGYSLMDNAAVFGGVSYIAGPKVGDYRTNDMLLGAGFGYGLSERLSVGVNVRFARQALTKDVAYSAASVDVSFADKLSDNLTLAGGVSTIGGKVKSAAGDSYSQPANVYAGAGYMMEAGSDATLNIDASAEYYFQGSYAASAGLRYSYGDFLNLRAGYRFASESCVVPSHLAFGAGAVSSGMAVDLSCMLFPSATVIAVGVGYAF